ncbi:MAG: hypothetical protein H6737_29705 [Alphaproteobacteria bacterium]|nr:hypothetical protein [Alphaproteobacteria bacterium]
MGMHHGDMAFAIREMAVACERGNENRVRQLLAWGVDPCTEVDGYSLLTRAARFGQYMVVKRLLQAGAKPSMVALVAGVGSGSRHTVEHIADSLVFEGEDPAAFAWNTVLGRREMLEQLTPDMATWLVANGIDLDETDGFGRSIAELAEQFAKRDVVEILLKKRK